MMVIADISMMSRRLQLRTRVLRRSDHQLKTYMRRDMEGRRDRDGIKAGAMDGHRRGSRVSSITRMDRGSADIPMIMKGERRIAV